MSHDEPQRENSFLTNRILVKILAAIPISIILLLLYLIMRPTVSPTTDKSLSAIALKEDRLSAARADLAQHTDLDTCRSALDRINTHLTEDAETRVPALNAKQVAKLRKLCNLNAEELAEVESGNFTRLDGQYLDCCFLMRDVARTLDVRVPVGDEPGKAVHARALDQATRAFEWVMRQVRLHEHDGAVVPPHLVLRRGWGSSLERGLVFLALLEQMGDAEEAPAKTGQHLLGCLLLCPDAKTMTKRLWTCGVVLPDRSDLYLFDPRLGLPLPGEQGKGVATLATVCKNPAVLRQLQVKAEHPYDTTTEQVRQAEIFQVCPLSALAPRMRLLQEQLLPPVVRVHLALDPWQDRQRLQTSVRTAGLPEDAVHISSEGVRQLRQFLPPDEGGSDQGSPFLLRTLTGFTRSEDPSVVKLDRQRYYKLSLVPWSALPPLFQDNNRFPYNVGLGQQVRDIFGQSFVRSILEAGRARDLILRGHFTKAASELVREQNHWRGLLEHRPNVAALERPLQQWMERALHLYAEQQRTRNSPHAQEEVNRQIQELWKRSEPITILLQDAVAGPRDAQITLLLALCKHEQAEQFQARQERASARTDSTKVHTVWKDALSRWQEYCDRYPRGAGIAQAQLLRGRALVMLSDKRAAVAVWEDLSAPMTPLEKVARLYLAQRLGK